MNSFTEKKTLLHTYSYLYISLKLFSWLIQEGYAKCNSSSSNVLRLKVGTNFKPDVEGDLMPKCFLTLSCIDHSKKDTSFQPTNFVSYIWLSAGCQIYWYCHVSITQSILLNMKISTLKMPDQVRSMTILKSEHKKINFQDCIAILLLTHS